MTTPKKQDIIDKAFAIYQKKNHNVSSITPEIEEMKEDGTYEEAKNSLMRSQDVEYKSYVEQQARDLGLLKDEYLETKPFMVDLEEALRSGVYVCGTTGIGKTDIGMYIASLLMKHGIMVIVFDSSQDWQTRSNVPQYRILRSCFVQDVPQTSQIYDTSMLSIPQQQALVELFCQKLMKYQAEISNALRREYFLIFEEASTCFPEGCMKAKKFQNTVKMMTQGRNYKVRFMAMTQFSSLIDKNVMRYMKQRYFGYSDEKSDVCYVASFIGKENTKTLKTLELGQFLYYNKGKVKLIEIEPYATEKKPIHILAPQKVVSEPEPIKTQNYSNERTLSGIVLLLIWLAILIVALSQH
jgi:hypothetical protein